MFLRDVEFRVAQVKTVDTLGEEVCYFLDYVGLGPQAKLLPLGQGIGAVDAPAVAPPLGLQPRLAALGEVAAVVDEVPPRQAG